MADSELNKGPHPFPIIIALDNIRSAHNVGAIFRTCDGAGVSKLLLGGITPYPPHNKIPKTALGAIEMVEWEQCPELQQQLTNLRQQGFQICAVEQTATAKPYTEYDYQQPSVFVLGHEITGVSSQVLSLADHHLQIPMYGQKRSLNVATTTGIVCFHAAANQYNR